MSRGVEHPVLGSLSVLQCRGRPCHFGPQIDSPAPLCIVYEDVFGKPKLPHQRICQAFPQVVDVVPACELCQYWRVAMSTGSVVGETEGIYVGHAPSLVHRQPSPLINAQILQTIFCVVSLLGRTQYCWCDVVVSHPPIINSEATYVDVGRHCSRGQCAATVRTGW